MAQERYADLILVNARVRTLEASNPVADFVAVKQGRVIGGGGVEEADQFKGPGTKEMDCQGHTLLPGFIDAHCHLFALASTLRSVDCRRDSASSISEIVEAIKRRAETTLPAINSGHLPVSFPESTALPTGIQGQIRWIRAFGYDEFYLREKRHPTKWDLDRAAPFHPVRLDHRGGHASVLNSRALELLNINRDTADPPDGIIVRDEGSGEPTGVLFEMNRYISSCSGVSRDESSFLEGIRMANGLLISKGVTSIQDAGPENDAHRWLRFQELKDRGLLTPRVSVMAGESHLKSFADLGQEPGFGGDTLRLGAVKIVLTLTTGTLSPDVEELRRVVLLAHERGFQIAIHAVEEEAVEAVADALIYAQSALPRQDARHRVEHCSECPPRIVQKLKAGGALVVTQPSFIYHVGEKYLSLVEERLLPHLYPVGSLTRAGVPVAAGSDAPVTYPDPLLSIYSSVARRTSDGSSVSASQAVPLDAALKLHTLGGAFASFEESTKGSIAVGKLADLALLDGDLTAVEPEGIRGINPLMTIVGGEVVWQR